MKIDYIRNMQASFMRLALDGELSKTEAEMLSRNQIEGMLAMTWQKEDENYILQYHLHE